MRFFSFFFLFFLFFIISPPSLVRLSRGSPCMGSLLLHQLEIFPFSCLFSSFFYLLILFFSFCLCHIFAVFQPCSRKSISSLSPLYILLTHIPLLHIFNIYICLLFFSYTHFLILTFSLVREISVGWASHHT